MIYPVLHLHRAISDDRNEDYFVQPAKIIDFEPNADGKPGSIIWTDTSDGPSATIVNESPDMIRKGINDAIVGASSLATKGAIHMQLAASEEMQKKASGIALPRINGV